MTRRSILPLVALAAVVVVLIGVAVVGPPEPAEGALAPGVTPPPSPQEGVVVEVMSEGLDRVYGFTLRTADGSSWTFRIGTLENPLEFQPGHLRSHQADSYPVRVWFQVEDRVLVAVRLEDGDPE